MPNEKKKSYLQQNMIIYVFLAMEIKAVSCQM